MRIRRLLILAASMGALALAGGSAVVACVSPTQDALIESLGEEVEGVPQGEFHRYGQPCLYCHGGYGPSPQFSFGGTVFAQPDDEVPVSGAKVTVTDSTGQKKTMTSNCAGNFYVAEADYKPIYPVRIEVVCETPAGFDGVSFTYRNLMGTRVNREGSCAACHANEPASQDGPGRIYCVDERYPSSYQIDPDCQGGPKLGDAGSATAAGSSVSSGDAASSGSGGEP